MSALLLSQPSNYTRALAGARRRSRRATSGASSTTCTPTCASPITLADLVRESGVAGRTLIKHFRDFKGVPPMRYLRDLRLKRVRAELGKRQVEARARFGAALGLRARRALLRGVPQALRRIAVGDVGTRPRIGDNVTQGEANDANIHISFRRAGALPLPARTAQDAAARNLASACAICHGTDGRAATKDVVPLAGLPAASTSPRRCAPSATASARPR